MTETDIAARERILQTVIDLLNEKGDANKITMRALAERANVGLGAINYNFQSKDKLMNEAVGVLMMAEAQKWIDPETAVSPDPEVRLRYLLKQTTLIGIKNPKLLELSVRYELEQGQFTVAEMVVPLLREIAAGKVHEEQIRLAAVQLITSMQVVFLRRQEVQRFTGIDISQEEHLLQAIDQFIDNIIINLK